MVVYPIIYKVVAPPRWLALGFLNHQQNDPKAPGTCLRKKNEGPTKVPPFVGVSEGKLTQPIASVCMVYLPTFFIKINQT